jgi:hypothetical protein
MAFLSCRTRRSWRTRAWFNKEHERSGCAVHPRSPFSTRRNPGPSEASHVVCRDLTGPPRACDRASADRSGQGGCRLTGVSRRRIEAGVLELSQLDPISADHCASAVVPLTLVMLRSDGWAGSTVARTRRGGGGIRAYIAFTAIIALQCGVAPGTHDSLSTLELALDMVIAPVKGHAD